MTTTSTESQYVDVLKAHVGKVVGNLQANFLSERKDASAKAAATLARLRRAVLSEPGADPTVWGVMFEDWPEQLRARSDDPSRQERAAHAALTLYAVHQQSKRERRMHVGGRSLGQAVGTLNRALNSAPGVRRRFDMLATAQSFDEILHHARGLVTQLRGENIPLDYGLLANHLSRLQRPAFADQVRLAWARDFYRTQQKSADNQSTLDSDPTSATADPEGESE